MECFEKIELSEAQKQAVRAVGKNVCVSAGAGSGKTRVLVERFLYLVMQEQISPAQILAVTFTEKAANEMKRRIVKRLREENLEEARRGVENAYIGTLHAFSARLLREHPVEGGVDPHFVILEAEEAAVLKEQALDQVIESQAADGGVFNFFRIYGEKAVRSGILDAFQRSRNSEAPFETLLGRRAEGSLEFFESVLTQGLQEIQGVNGAREVSGAIPRFFKRRDFSFEEIKELTALKKNLRAQGQQKEAIQRVKERIDDFAGFLFEEKTLSAREIFIRLALEFEKGYVEAKRAERALDFDDLQLGAVRLLGRESPAPLDPSTVPRGLTGPASRMLRKIYQERFREILVDEFQDTNRLQDRLLELLRREANLFIVGDLKQSIFAFRGTRVELFVAKEKAFQESPAGLRVSLAENHRSRPALIDFVNRFFARLWQEDGIPFEPLKAQREEEGSGPRVERLALEKSKEESLDEIRIREARTLAGRLRSLVEKEGFLYKEIACLFEAMTNVHFYEQEFRRAGIPYFVVSNRGFYSQLEIRDLVSFLSALENPRRDVPLAASLRSPLFQISDDALFWLARQAKKENKETPLFEGVRQFEFVGEIPEKEKEKLRFFRETFDRFLEEKEKLRISELIEKALHLTRYDLYVLKLRQGERRFANLRKLVEIAREMESKEPLHLGDFVRAVKGLEMREVRESQAQVEAEEGNVVRLMTIHLSKGLEFPVVILPDLGRKDPAGGGLSAFSEEEGFGIKAWDEPSFDFQDTFTFRHVKKRLDRINSEESKRKLYVAMTRARERLILAGPRSDEKKEKSSFHEMATWADWVDRILSEGDWSVTYLSEAPPEPFPFERRKALAERKPIRSCLENLSAVKFGVGREGRKHEVFEEVDRILENLTRPETVYFQRIDLPVSAFLLFAKDPEEYFRVYEIGTPSETAGAGPRACPDKGQPQGVAPTVEVKEEEPQEEEGISRAEFGTRVHQILERALIRGRDRGSARPAPTKEIEAMVSRFVKDLGEKQAQEILEIVTHFLKSREAEEILKAGRFHPELPFVLRLPQGLIHGTMDLLYQNSKGEWVILDYKTSEVDEKTFTARGEDYRVQLELYALATSQILGQAPQEARIHFLRRGLTHRIPLQTADFKILFDRFTGLQKEILRFRQEKIIGEGSGKPPGPSS